MRRVAPVPKRHGKRRIDTMTWNYRIFRHTEGENTWYAIHECHYDDEGNIEGYTLEPETPIGETIEELRADLEYMLNDAFSL